MYILLYNVSSKVTTRIICQDYHISSIVAAVPSHRKEAVSAISAAIIAATTAATVAATSTLWMADAMQQTYTHYTHIIIIHTARISAGQVLYVIFWLFRLLKHIAKYQIFFFFFDQSVFSSPVRRMPNAWTNFFELFLSLSHFTVCCMIYVYCNKWQTQMLSVTEQKQQ